MNNIWQIEYILIPYPSFTASIFEGDTKRFQWDKIGVKYDLSKEYWVLDFYDRNISIFYSGHKTGILVDYRNRKYAYYKERVIIE